MNGNLLQGKKILITGGSRGIGAACVRTAVRWGAVVGFTYISSEERALELIEEVPGDAYCFRASVSDPSAMKEVMETFSSIDGTGLQGLVVNAGVYRRTSVSDILLEDWRTTIETNLDGSFITVKEALPFMEDGSIVMISSQLAFKGSDHGSDYSASKAGMIGLARSLARELAPKIRVNTVSPGFVDTDLLSGDSPEKRVARIGQVPLSRIGTPDDIANAVGFLLSDLSSYVTGADLDVNGGLYIH